MRWLRRIGTAVVIGSAIVLVLLYAAFLFLSRVETIPKRPAPADYSALALADKVGWYEFAHGDVRLLTFGADTPLQLVRFGEVTQASRLSLQSDGAFAWHRESGGSPIFVEFTAADDGSPTAVTWEDAAGRRQSAMRREGFGYRVGELKYESDGTPLAATLFLPMGKGPFPAAVMIHGSGDSHRGNTWYMTIANRLVGDGIAVLLPDKRGCGASGGEWRTASLEEFADDVVAAVKVVRRQSEIDPKCVGLVGISQGGWIAPIVAAKHPEVAFVVNLCGASVPVIRQLEHETYATLGQTGVPAWLRRVLVPVAMAVPQRRRPVWWKLNGQFDPMPYWEKVEQPTLVVYGQEDEQDNVPVAESVARLETLVKKGHDVTIQVFPDSGHGLYRPETRVVREDFLELLSEWIRSKTAPSVSPLDDQAEKK